VIWDCSSCVVRKWVDVYRKWGALIPCPRLELPASHCMHGYHIGNWYAVKQERGVLSVYIPYTMEEPGEQCTVVYALVYPPTIRFRNNSSKDDSGLFSRFLRVCDHTHLVYRSTPCSNDCGESKQLPEEPQYFLKQKFRLFCNFALSKFRTKLYTK